MTIQRQTDRQTDSSKDYTAELSYARKCNGIIGVPITYLDKFCPEQFKIIGLDRYTVPKELLVGGRVALNGKPCYARILIQKM